MGALFIPELEISEEEAAKLTKALAGVSDFYSQAIDPKKLAWIELMGVAGTIYGTRVMAFMVRRKIEANRKPRVDPLPGNQQKNEPPPQPTARQTVAANAIPPTIRGMFSDPSFVADLGDE